MKIYFFLLMSPLIAIVIAGSIREALSYESESDIFKLIVGFFMFTISMMAFWSFYFIIPLP